MKSVGKVFIAKMISAKHAVSRARGSTMTDLKPEDIEPNDSGKPELVITTNNYAHSEQIKKEILEALEFYNKFHDKTVALVDPKEYKELKEKASILDKFEKEHGVGFIKRFTGGFTILNQEESIRHQELEAKVKEKNEIINNLEKESLDLTLGKSELEAKVRELKELNKLNLENWKENTKENQKNKVKLQKVREELDKRYGGIYDNMNPSINGKPFGECQECDLWDAINKILGEEK